MIWYGLWYGYKEKAWPLTSAKLRHSDYMHAVINDDTRSEFKYDACTQTGVTCTNDAVCDPVCSL